MRGQGVAVEKKKIRRILHSFLPDPEEFLCSSSLILFFLPEFLRRTFVTWEGGGYFDQWSIPLLFLSSHRFCQGEEEEKEREREEKKWSKDKCVPEKQLFWTISKRKGLSFPGSRYFARDGAISRQLLRPSCETLPRYYYYGSEFLFSTLRVVVFVGKKKHTTVLRTFIYVFIKKKNFVRRVCSRIEDLLYQMEYHFFLSSEEKKR